MARSADQWGRDAEERPAATIFKAALLVTLGVLALTALVGVITTGSVFFQAGAAKITNKARETIIVYNPERTLSTYEGFYRACNQYNALVIAADEKLAGAKQAEKSYNPDTDPFGNAQRDVQEQYADARGTRQVAQQEAAAYNADASANTRAPFKAAELPYALDATAKTPAQCGTGKEGTR